MRSLRLLVRDRIGGGEQRARFSSRELVTAIAKFAVDADHSAFGEDALHFSCPEKPQRGLDTLARARAGEARSARTKRPYIVSGKERRQRLMRVIGIEETGSRVDRLRSADPRIGVGHARCRHALQQHAASPAAPGAKPQPALDLL